MEAEEKIQAHVLSIWREGRGFFSGKGREGMLILTNKNLCFIKKTEAPMKWWGAIRTRQIVRLLQSNYLSGPNSTPPPHGRLSFFNKTQIFVG